MRGATRHRAPHRKSRKGPIYTEYYLGLSNGTVEEGTTLGDILWGEDDFLDGFDLAVDFHDGTTAAVATEAPPLDIQGDGAAMYWGDQHLEKTTL